MLPPRLAPDSDSSDTIYEKIDGPPSPCSSTDSNAGVEAPLIHHKWKLADFKVFQRTENCFCGVLSITF